MKAERDITPAQRLGDILAYQGLDTLHQTFSDSDIDNLPVEQVIDLLDGVVAQHLLTCNEVQIDDILFTLARRAAKELCAGNQDAYTEIAGAFKEAGHFLTLINPAGVRQAVESVNNPRQPAGWKKYISITMTQDGPRMSPRTPEHIKAVEAFLNAKPS